MGEENRNDERKQDEQQVQYSQSSDNEQQESTGSNVATNEPVKKPDGLSQQAVNENMSETAKKLINDYKDFDILFKAEETATEVAESNAKKNKYHTDYKMVLKIASVYAMLAVSAAVLGISIFRGIQACAGIDHELFLSVNLIVGVMAVDIVMLIISSAWSHWNYNNRKRWLLLTIIALSGVAFFEIIYTLISAAIVPLLLLPEPNKWVTPSKWMFLIRSVTIFPSLILLVLFIQWELEVSLEKFAFERLCKFRIMLHVDLRKNKKFKYDAKIAKAVETSKRWTIRETDRYMHVLIIGATGTAKTSSIIIPMINGDLKTRCRNEDKLKEIMWAEAEKYGKEQKEKAERLKNVTTPEERKAIEAEPSKCDFKLKRPITDRTFSLDAFLPLNKKAEARKKALAKRYRVAGMTVVGPDDSLSDAAYKLCVSKNIPCNRVDPVPDRNTDGERKEGFRGFNPLYISPRIPKYAWLNEVIKRARLFADVMQGINDMKGESDVYFSSVNRSMTVAFSICLGVTMPTIDGRQPTPADVQYHINNFDRIRPYYAELKKYNAGLTGDNANHLNFVLDYLDYDILGKGREKMMEQSRGLRNLMDEFLTNPLIRRTLCASAKDTVDMIAMLEEGQVTVVNYALELGETDSTAFGQFFLLSFINAVWHRDSSEGSTIAPHVLIVDELPVIIHPLFEKAISLFRKYKVSIVGCLQSLTQMEKNRTTAYLKSTLIGGCATLFQFGRCSEEDQRQLMELCGRTWEPVVQTSQTETSITDENPSLSYSTRESLQQVNIVEGSSVRNLPFQQALMITVTESNLVDPFFVKVDFLSKKEQNWKKRSRYPWNTLYEYIDIPETPIDNISKKTAEEELEKKENKKPARDINSSEQGHTTYDTSGDTEQTDELSVENNNEDVVTVKIESPVETFNDEDDEDEGELLSVFLNKDNDKRTLLDNFKNDADEINEEDEGMFVESDDSGEAFRF